MTRQEAARYAGMVKDTRFRLNKLIQDLDEKQLMRIHTLLVMMQDYDEDDLLELVQFAYPQWGEISERLNRKRRPEKPTLHLVQ
ncbi:hypothetical protein MYX82_03815 [Acidobacteria bacterium AH-259-D05]|nr:hypothetical protein [Acidobacteria bacterium AH-259-D05]